MTRALVSLTCLVALPGCALLSNNQLRFQVDHPEEVVLERVGMTSGLMPDRDYAHARTLLPAGREPRVESAPYRTTSVPARRNTDGSIDLLLWNGVWPVVRSDGTITALRSDAYDLPVTGSAYAFLAAPPQPLGGRTPWELRLSTPRENVRDARLLVRRDRVAGAVLIAAGALLLAYGSAASYLAWGRRNDQPEMPIAFGVFGLSTGLFSTGAGLFQLFRREHDEVLTSPVGER